jgi:hypothetical protein
VSDDLEGYGRPQPHDRIVRGARGPHGEPLEPDEIVACECPECACPFCGEPWEGHGDPDACVPPCAIAMRCLCAAHARGRAADQPCDANEDAAP